MERSDFSVLIPDGENDFALSVLRCLSRVRGIKTFVASGKRYAPSRFSRIPAGHFNRRSSYDDDEQRIEALCDIARRSHANVVLPVGQRTIRLASAHARTLRETTAVAPIPDPGAFEIAADKWLFAKFLDSHGIEHPPTICYSAHDGFDRQLTALRFPVLIKPAHGSYGRGIKLFKSADDLHRHFRESPPQEQFVVQTFIEGYDVDCSVLCVDGRVLAYTVQKGVVPGYSRFGAAAGIDFIHDDDAYAVASRVVSALRWSGIAHLDLRYDTQAQHVKAIEMNPRYWGSLLGSLIAGVNFPYLACLAALGREVPHTTYARKRFVAGRAALRIMTGALLGREKLAIGLGDTSFAFTLSDPLPDVLGPIFASRKR